MPVTQGSMTPPVLSARYELHEQVGAGAMGEVWRATDHQLGRPVAVKLVRADLSHRPEMADRIRREAMAAASITHPSAVVVFDAGEWDGGPFIVMELLPGRTFDDEVREGPVAPDRARTVAVDALRALGAAHRLGIIHRDIKPGNLLLAQDGRVKVGDFGIARSSESLSLTSTGQLLGTPVYMAPERLEGGPATASCDIYAMGVVLYEALSGARPFGGDTPLAVAVAATTTTAVPLSERCPAIDPGLAAVVERAMAPDPDQRYDLADEMADDLAAVPTGGATAIGDREDATGPTPQTRVMAPMTAAGEATRAQAPIDTGWASAPSRSMADAGPPEVKTRRRRGAPRLTTVAAGMALALVVLVGIWLLGRDGDAPPLSDDLPSTTDTTGVVEGDIPAPLEESLRRLEELATR